MNKKFEKLGFYPANILMPKGQDMHKWAVVACAIILAALIIDVVGKKFEEAREAKTMAALKAEHHKELQEMLAQRDAQANVQA